MTALPPLSRADATELFLRVVRNSGIGSDHDPAAVDRVVTLCGGLPLALRIAGALHVHDHPRPVGELASRLTELGPGGLEYGELSVARTIGAGLERLDVGARTLFLAFGQLRLVRFGTWTATAVLDGRADAAAALSRLAAGFMVDPVESELRYRFHDLTREYARRRALTEDSDAFEGTPERVYRALLTLTRRAHGRLHGGAFEVVHSLVPDWNLPADVLAEVDDAPLSWFEKERLNIKAAVEHSAELGLTEICWDLAVSAHEFYTIRGYYDDWYTTHQTALQACRTAGDPRGEGIVLACLNQPALAASRRTATSSALADLHRAARLLADCGDRHGTAIAQRTLANTLRRLGHATRARELFAEALTHYTDSGDIVGQWQTWRYIGQSHLDRADCHRARAALQEAERIAAELDDSRLLAQTRYWTGQACLSAGDLSGARAAFASVFDVYRADQGVGRAYALHGLGDLALREDASATAERHLLAAAELARDGADAVLEGRVWLSLGLLRHQKGQTGERLAALERAAALFAACGATYLEVRAIAEVAEVAYEAGLDIDAATAWNRIDALYTAARVPQADRVRRPAASDRDAVA